MAPFGFISDGVSEGTSFVDKMGIDGMLMNMVVIIHGIICNGLR